MKTFTIIILSLTFSSTAFCDERYAVAEDRNLIEMLAAEKTVAYSMRSNETRLIAFTLLSDDVKNQVHEYYKGNNWDAGKYEHFRRAYDDLMAGLREGKTSPERLAEAGRELAKLRGPTGSKTAAVVIRYGRDYVVIRALNSGRELVVPISRMDILTDDRRRAEPSHATESAAEPTENEDSPAPAR